MYARMSDRLCRHTMKSDFFMSFGDPNSDLQACIANDFPLSYLPSLRIFFVIYLSFEIGYKSVAQTGFQLSAPFLPWHSKCLGYRSWCQSGYYCDKIHDQKQLESSCQLTAGSPSSGRSGQEL